MTDNSRMAVIIVNWNVADLLRDCLQSVRTSSGLEPDELDIIVVDNGSTDNSVAMVKKEFPEVELMETGANLGFAGGCQYGYDRSSAPIVCLLNPDTVVEDGMLARLRDGLLENPQIGIIGAKLMNTDGSFQRATGGAFPSLRSVIWNYLFFHKLLPEAWSPPAIFLDKEPQSQVTVDWVSGASLTFRREIIGPHIFDPEIFMFGEDMDLCYRIREKGYDVVIDGTGKITHHQGQSFKQQHSLEVLSSIHKGPRTFFRRHHGLAASICYDMILLLGYILRVLIFSTAFLVTRNTKHKTMAQFSRRYLAILVKTWLSANSIKT